ncbi:MAG: radical SAM protein [Mariprofundaceae bacterium]
MRLAGCPLRCHYCDTPQAIPTDSGSEMTLHNIIEQVKKLGHSLVLVTGGEPLAQGQCIALLEALDEITQTVQLETSGAYDIEEVPSSVHTILDIKTPSSGESERNRWSNLKCLKNGNEIKFVISDRNDYQWAKEIINQYQIPTSIPLLFSPSWNQLDPQKLVQWILEDKLPVRLQLQQHKYIWGAEVTGV